MNTITFGTGGDYATLREAVLAHDFSVGSALFTQVGDSLSTETQIVDSQEFYGNVCWIKGDKNYSTTCDIFAQIGDDSSGDIYIEGLDVTCTQTFVTIDDYEQPSLGIVSVFNNRVIAGTSAFLCYGTSYRTFYIYNNEIVSAADILGGNLDGTLYFEDNTIHTITSDETLPIIDAIDTTTALAFKFRRNYLSDTRDNILGTNIISDSANVTSEFFIAGTSTQIVAGNRSLAFDDANFNSTVQGNIEYGVPRSDSVMTTTATQGTAIPTHNVGANGVTVTTWAAGAFKPRVYLSLPLNVTVENIQTGARVRWTNNTEVGYEKTYLYWETISVDEAFVTPKATVDAGVVEYTIPYDQLAGSTIWYLRIAHGA